MWLFLLLLVRVVADTAPSFWPRHLGAHSAALLDGEWDFGFASALDSVAAGFDSVPMPNKTVVPGSVDAAPPGVVGARGVSFFRTRFSTATGTQQWLEFMACSFYCKAWVDGVLIGEHRAGGYVPFALAVPASTADARELVVLADNRFNATTAPMHTGGDFWHYGGLVRSVVLHTAPLKTNVVRRAIVSPYLSASDGRWLVNVSVVCGAAWDGDLRVSLHWHLDGGTVDVDLGSHTLRFAKGVAVLAAVAAPSAASQWSLQQPTLQTLSVTADGGGVTERFGLRVWGSSAGGRVTLNGAVVQLHGWNHHTQWPETGCSPTDEQLDFDLALLLRGGANYVRGAHYPQDQRWLDRLDAAGVAMWEEALGPGVETAMLQDEAWMAQQLQQLEEMVQASANHAAIMTWGFFNEGPSSDADACAGYATCAARLRELDATRFVTWASNHESGDKCLQHASLIAFNSYPGWYSSEGDLSAPATHWSAMAAWVRREFPKTPFVISETGAGGIYEWDDNKTDVRWSLEYQTEIVSRDVDAALDNPIFSGITLWHFFDFKGNDDAQKDGPCDYLPDVSPPTCGYIDVSKNRPGGLNHKGSVDFYRREKPIFNIVAAKYNATSTRN